MIFWVREDEAISISGCVDELSDVWLREILVRRMEVGQRRDNWSLCCKCLLNEVFYVLEFPVSKLIPESRPLCHFPTWWNNIAFKKNMLMMFN